MDDIETMLPQPMEIEIGGEAVSISPLKVRQLPGVLRRLRGLWRHFDGESPDVVEMLAENADDLIGAISVAVEKPRQWIEDLELNEIVRLVSAVIEVNADFFNRAVLPEIRKAASGIQAVTQAFPGLTSSSS